MYLAQLVLDSATVLQLVDVSQNQVVKTHRSQPVIAPADHILAFFRLALLVVWSLDPNLQDESHDDQLGVHAD